MDRTKEWGDLLRSARPENSRNKPVSNIMARKKPADGSPSGVATALMDGIRRTWAMLREQECSYTALRGGLDDSQRDELDDTVRTFVGDCSDRIDDLKKKMVPEGKTLVNIDELAHLKGMVLVLLESLDNLSQYFQKFKAFRVKQALRQRSAFDVQSAEFTQQNTIKSPSKEASRDELDLNAEEQSMFERENLQLQEELDSKIEQLREAEREMNLITSMCELTSHKIMEQAQEIDALYDTVVKAVEDIDLGNVQLQKAAEATVPSRFFMLVFLFVASVVLLFLHWFMD